MEDKEKYIQWFLQNNPTASREQAELSYFTENNLQGQIKRGYANSDGTLNSFVVDRLRDIDVRTPFGMNIDGKYVGPSIEDYIMSGVNDRPKYDVRVLSDITGVEQELLDIDKTRTHMIGGGRYPNLKVVGEYEGRPNPYNAGYNSQYKQQIEEGTRQSRPEGNQRHVTVKDDNGRIFDLNLDMPHEGLGEPGNSNFPRHLANDPYYTPYKGEDGYRRGNRWRRLNQKDGTWLPNVANYVEKSQAVEDIKLNPDGTITHYNTMRYHIPEVEAARIRNAQPDNIFSQSHIFADGGKMKRRSEPSPETVDYFSRHAGTPMTIGELNRMREKFYAEQDEKARQEKEMRDFVIKQRERYFKKLEEDRLRMAEEARNRWFNGQPSTDTSDKTEEQPAETGNSKSQWLNPLSPEWLKTAFIPSPKPQNESVTTRPRAAQNSGASGKSNNQVANTNDEIDKLALDVIRGKYGNGKQRREALGDLYSVVQKRANEMLKGKRSNKNSSTRESQVADANRKAWDETPEEWKQPLKSISPRTFNPRSYDLTTDDLRLHELASQQAQQERSLDENPHSLIRDNGEIKRRIGGTNNYDIYL